MKIYLASKFFNRKDAGMKYLAQELKNAGHSITSSWMHQRKEPNPRKGSDDYYRKLAAIRDRTDLDNADVVVVWHRKMGAPTGGAYWEMGYSMAKKKFVILLNPDHEPIRMIFCLLPDVIHTKTIKETLEVLSVLNNTSYKL